MIRLVSGPCRPLSRICAWILIIALTTIAHAQEKPEVPIGVPSGDVVVALFDTGVNYTLPGIAERLARDGEGLIIGFDFEDGDLKPFDAKPGDTSDPPRRHGTTVASILLAEAPTARIAPYRYKAGDPSSFAHMVAHVAFTPARIVAVPLGGHKKEDWEQFRTAAEANPQLLFIVSAGNDGQNIDRHVLYPAAFGLDNVLVVAATDPFGRFASDANWGVNTVHLATPAERIAALDFSGAQITASGSSFAVPRIAALAARILTSRPDIDASQLKDKLLDLAGPNPAERRSRTKYGWIADPAKVSVRD